MSRFGNWVGVIVLGLIVSYIYERWFSEPDIHRIGYVRSHFRARVTLDRPEFQKYRSRLESGVQALKEKYDTDRAAFYNEHSGGTSHGLPNDDLRSLTIGPDHPLFPNAKSEPDAYRLFMEATLHFQFYREPISFDRHPLGTSGGIQADTEMDFYAPERKNGESLTNRVEFRYEFGRDDVLLQFSKELDPNWLQKTTAKIESISDLPESQVFVTAETGWSSHADVSLNHHPELELAILWINGHPLPFRSEEMTRHVNPESGVPIFEYLFPKDLSAITRK